MWLNLAMLWSWFPFFGTVIETPPPPPISHTEQVEVFVESPLAKKEKEWTFLVYAAGDNDLSEFTSLDIKEMEKIGSNDLINIVVYLDQEHATSKTEYLHVQKGFSNQIKIHDEKLDSGNPDTLINFFEWAMKNYPAKNYALVLWNHGSGILDPVRTAPSQRNIFFHFDPHTKTYGINRNISFLDFFRSQKNKNLDLKGVCFSDTYGTYLTNQKLQYALRVIATEILKRKIDIVAFDACLMAMLEIADIVKHYAHYMVGSEEIEMGNGWLYSDVLEPFSKGTLTREQFAKHIVASYESGYLNVCDDYTQSAITLNRIDTLKENVDKVAGLLVEALYHQQDFSVKAVIKVASSPRMCTHYSEQTYIDLYDFYNNLLRMLYYVRLNQGHETIKDELSVALKAGMELISQTVLANVAGTALSKSKGISIYFPTQYVDHSYEKTSIFKETRWGQLISCMV